MRIAALLRGKIFAPYSPKLSGLHVSRPHPPFILKAVSASGRTPIHSFD